MHPRLPAGDRRRRYDPRRAPRLAAALRRRRPAARSLDGGRDLRPTASAGARSSMPAQRRGPLRAPDPLERQDRWRRRARSSGGVLPESQEPRPVGRVEEDDRCTRAADRRRIHGRLGPTPHDGAVMRSSLSSRSGWPFVSSRHQRRATHSRSGRSMPVAPQALEERGRATEASNIRGVCGESRSRHGNSGHRIGVFPGEMVLRAVHPGSPCGCADSCDTRVGSARSGLTRMRRALREPGVRLHDMARSALPFAVWCR